MRGRGERRQGEGERGGGGIPPMYSTPPEHWWFVCVVTLLRDLLDFGTTRLCWFPRIETLLSKMPYDCTNAAHDQLHFTPRPPPLPYDPHPSLSRGLGRFCRRRLGKIAPGSCMCHCLMACFLTPGDVSIGFTCRVKVEGASAPYGSSTSAAAVTPGRPGIAGSGADAPPPSPLPMLWAS